MILSSTDRLRVRGALASRIIARATQRAAARVAAATLLRGESVASASAGTGEKESRLQAAIARRHFRRSLERDALWRRYCAISDEERASGRYWSPEGNAVLRRWAWTERRAKHLLSLADPGADRTMGGSAAIRLGGLESMERRDT